MEEDKIITCADCGKEFTHTAEDQRRYAERGFTADPKRCRECRQARKEKQAQTQGAPRGAGGKKPFGGGGPRREGRGDRPGYGGGGGRGGPRQGGGGGGYGSRGPRGQGGSRQSYDVICAACGAPTTVPFEPTQGREVFCRDCFRKMREA
jgi:CxxC-x17-CxxC domain-containing protein